MEKRKVSKVGSIALVAALSVGAFGMLPMAFDSASASFENYDPSDTKRKWKNYTLNATPAHVDDSINTIKDVHMNNFDATLFEKANAERKARGLKPLKTTVELDDLADARAIEIQDRFSHVGFGGRIPGPASKNGENIYMFPGLYAYMNYPELVDWDFSWHYSQPFEGYKKSTKGHWEALMDPNYTHMGVSTHVDSRGVVTNAIVFAQYRTPQTDGAPDKTEIPVPKLIDPKEWNSTQETIPDPLIEFLNGGGEETAPPVEPEPEQPADPEPTPTEPPVDPEPEEPTVPVDPEPEPEEPTDPPVEPEEPTEPPVEPEPEEPTDPVDPPVDPEPTPEPEPEPEEPTVPVDPEPEPEEPTEPVDPPAEPEPTPEPEPEEPTVPVEPEPEPEEPTDPPVEPEEPTEPVDPEPEEPTDPPVEPEPEEPTEPEVPEEPEPEDPGYTVDENGVKVYPDEMAQSGAFESSFSSSLTRDRFVMDDSGSVRDMSELETRALRDLDPKDPNTRNIIRAYEAGITRGFVKSDGVSFEPDVDVTRLDASVMLYRMYLAPDVDRPSESPFVDLGADNTFYDAALWTDQNNLIYANDNNEFRPDGTMTRGEMTEVLYKAEGEPEYEPVDPYVDVDPEASYAKSSEWFRSEGSIDAWDYSDTLHPEENATRGEFISSLFVTDAPRRMAD